MAYLLNMACAAPVHSVKMLLSMLFSAQYPKSRLKQAAFIHEKKKAKNTLCFALI